MQRTGLIINGQRVLVPGLNVINYLDDPRIALKMGKNMRLRHTRWIRAIGVHNTKNVATTLLPGKGKSTDLGKRLKDFWALNTTKPAGAHGAIDWDGTVYCMCDLVQCAAYHAGLWNEVSLGFEMFEDSQGRIYGVQVDAAVTLIEFLCHWFGIQRQCPAPSDTRQIYRLADAKGKDCGKDMVGVFGHCHQNHANKANDPGTHVFQALADNGFKTFDFNGGDDKTYWMAVQRRMGIDVDGVPGPGTHDALQARGFDAGLYDWKTVV